MQVVDLQWKKGLVRERGWKISNNAGHFFTRTIFYPFIKAFDRFLGEGGGTELPSPLYLRLCIHACLKMHDREVTGQSRFTHFPIIPAKEGTYNHYKSISASGDSELSNMEYTEHGLVSTPPQFTGGFSTQLQQKISSSTWKTFFSSFFVHIATSIISFKVKYK